MPRRKSALPDGGDRHAANDIGRDDCVEQEQQEILVVGEADTLQQEMETRLVVCEPMSESGSSGAMRI